MQDTKRCGGSRLWQQVWPWLIVGGLLLGSVLPVSGQVPTAGCSADSLRELFPKLEPGQVVVRVGLLLATDEGEQPVAFDHAFSTGDQVRLQVRASELGYLCLASRDAAGQLRRLWPSTGLAHPLPVGADTIVKGPQINGSSGDTRLTLLLATEPCDCPPPADQKRSKPRIRQIRLRALESADPACAFFLGTLDPAGIATIELTLRQHA